MVGLWRSLGKTMRKSGLLKSQTENYWLSPPFFKNIFPVPFQIFRVWPMAFFIWQSDFQPVELPDALGAFFLLDFFGNKNGKVI